MRFCTRRRPRRGRQSARARPARAAGGAERRCDERAQAPGCCAMGQGAAAPGPRPRQATGGARPQTMRPSGPRASGLGAPHSALLPPRQRPGAGGAHPQRCGRAGSARRTARSCRPGAGPAAGRCRTRPHPGTPAAPGARARARARASSRRLAAGVCRAVSGAQPGAPGARSRQPQLAPAASWQARSLARRIYGVRTSTAGIVVAGAKTGTRVRLYRRDRVPDQGCSPRVTATRTTWFQAQRASPRL